MSDRKAELTDLSTRFIDAFNKQDLDGIMSFFAEDGVFEDSEGKVHQGHAAIRAQFEPLISGSLGKYHFDDDDFFMDADAGKVMTSWKLTLDIDGKPVSLKGLDLLHFVDDKLVKKNAFNKAGAPRFE